MIIKALIYRIFRLLILFVSVYIISQNVRISGLTIFVDSILSTLYYIIFEYLWEKIKK